MGAYFLVRRFAKEDYLPFFVIVLFVLGIFAPDMAIGQYAVSMNTVFMPVAFLCMLQRYKSDEAKTKVLLLQLMIILGSAFIVAFLQSVFFACQGYGAISWVDFGSFIALAVSFTSAVLIGRVLSRQFRQDNYLFKALFLVIVSAIDASIFALLRFAFIGGITAQFVLLAILFAVIFAAISAFAVTLVEHMLLPVSYKKAESTSNEAMLEVTEEAPTEEAEAQPVEEQPAQEEPAVENQESEESAEETPAEPEAEYFIVN